MRHAVALGRALLLVGCVADLSHAQTAAPLILDSPDQRIRVRITVADRLSYAIDVDDRAITGACTLSMRIDQQVLGAAPRLLKSTARRHDGVVEPPVRQKAARLRDHYNEMRLDFDGQYAVVFRAYDEGVAYRFETTPKSSRSSRTTSATTCRAPSRIWPRRTSPRCPPSSMRATSRSPSPSLTSSTIPGCGCAAPAGAPWPRPSRRTPSTRR